MMLDARDVRLAVRAFIVLVLGLAFSDLVLAGTLIVQRVLTENEALVGGFEADVRTLVPMFGRAMPGVLGLFGAFVLTGVESRLSRQVYREYSHK